MKGKRENMGRLRFLIALWVAKLSIVALKITGHNGTNFPGVIAIKICPQFLRYIGKPKRIIAITGTNGKTTVTNMMIDGSLTLLFKLHKPDTLKYHRLR